MKAICTLTFVALSVMLHQCSLAQGNKRTLLSAGYGFYFNDPTLKLAIPAMQTVTGPVTLKFERQRGDHWSLGATGYFFKNNWEKNGFETINVDSEFVSTPIVYYNSVTGFSAVFRINYLIHKGKKTEFFAGAGAGLKINSWHIDPDTPPCYSLDCKSYLLQHNLENNWPVVIELTMGFRYFVIPRAALFCEAGFAKTALQIGLTYSFK